MEEIILKLKPMEYGKERIREIIGKGKINGIEFKILNLGSHPTAYIKLPEDSMFHGKSYDDIPINVHGGLTYGKAEEDGFWIGWDYAHCRDYYMGSTSSEFGKMWSTEEILETDVKSAIQQFNHIYKLEKSELIEEQVKKYKLDILNLILKLENLE